MLSVSDEETMLSAEKSLHCLFFCSFFRVEAPSSFWKTPSVVVLQLLLLLLLWFIQYSLEVSPLALCPQSLFLKETHWL